MKLGTCDMCDKPAVIRFSVTYGSGLRGWVRWLVASSHRACAEHMESLIAMAKEGII